MYCSNCGDSIPENSRYCSGCGASLSVNTKDDDNLVKLKKEAKWVNCTDEPCITQQKENYLQIPTPPEDIQYYECKGTQDLGLCIKKANGCTVYYYVNIDGKISSNQYDYASQDFTYGLAIVKFGDLYGMVNTKLEKVIATAYSELEVIKTTTSTVDYLIKVKKNEYYGCIDLKGKIIFQCIYQEIGTFRNGIVGVKLNGKYKFVDSKSNDVFPYYWSDYPVILSDDKVYFQINNEDFFLDEQGRLYLKKMRKETIIPKVPGINTTKILFLFFLIQTIFFGLMYIWISDNASLVLFLTTLIITITSRYCYYQNKQKSKPKEIEVVDWVEIHLNYLK